MKTKTLMESAQGILTRTLRDFYTRQRLENPAYSQRAFARRLGISSGALSEILNGRRILSEKMAERLLDRMNLDPQSRQTVRQAYLERKLGQVPSSEARASTKYVELSQDEFALIADWEHFAIRSLINSHSFRSEPEWVARRLNISVTRVEKAFERLSRLNLVYTTPSGRWKPKAKNYSSSDGVPNSAVRLAHAQSLKLAKKSLEEDPVEVRDFTQLTICIDPRHLDEARRRIRAFQDELATFLESGTRTEVYKLSMQLFPLTRVSDSPLMTHHKSKSKNKKEIES